jgi:hypothetical protein
MKCIVLFQAAISTLLVARLAPCWLPCLSVENFIDYAALR